MTGTVFGIVILAALLHAVWNALVKGGADKITAMTAMVIGQGSVAGLCLFTLAQSPNPESWPWIWASVVLHIGYQVFLMAAYRIGDMTQVYPIARGVAPLLVALVLAGVMGVVFSSMEVAGIALIALGVSSISFVRNADGLFQGKAAFLALMTGLFIAGYSLVDGIGARIAETALGFFAWVSFLNAVVYAAICAMIRPKVLVLATGLPKIMFLGGGASFAAYAMVVYAFTQAPIALVTALRETSIVFALLIGVLVFKEPLNLLKVLATAVTLAGAAVLRLAKG
jgi:drug/metabolite transporter (DMT)-like permease